jgi:hypothetical protein
MFGLSERFIQRTVRLRTGIKMKKNILNTMVAMASPPPPPPSKRSRKPLIAVIVVILIVVLAVGIYLAARGIGTNPSVTPTPTPSSGVTATPSSSITPTPTSSGTGVNVAGASSLQFTVSVTNSSGGTTSSYTYSAKNAGTTNMMIRVEFTDPSSGGSFVYIVNGAQQKAWMQTGGQWIDLTSSFSDEFSNWDSTFKDYQTSLADWNGLGDWSYTVGGETISIHNISVNPSLPDSLFEHS